jgi:hypothetical protein
MTAKTHVSRSMIKVHARTRAQLVVFAYESRLVLPRPPLDENTHGWASNVNDRRALAGHQSPQTGVALGPERVASRTRTGASSATVVA